MKRRVHFNAIVLLALTVLFGSTNCPWDVRPARAQDPQEEKPPLPVEPETPEFKAAADALRAHLKKMREVMVHYNTILPGPQDGEMRREWFAYHREGLPLYQRMLDAAVAEYQLAPNDKPALAEMLWGILERNTEVDRYEGMLAIAQALRAGGYENPELGSVTLRTAFALNDYDAMRQVAQEVIDDGNASPQLQTLLDGVDELEAAWNEELSVREQDAQGPPLPRILMHTTKGDIEFELFENQAPETVANFISLIESGFYDGLVFHRVIEQFMAQTGCPIGDGSGGPGYTIYGEADRPDARKYFRGTLGMALSAQPNSGGSQFFITFLPHPELNGRYTAFGRVVAGIDVLGDLVRVNPESEDEEKKKPARMLDEIVSIEVLSKRDHEYQPNKVK